MDQKRRAILVYRPLLDFYDGGQKLTCPSCNSRHPLAITPSQMVGLGATFAACKREGTLSQPVNSPRSDMES